MKKNEINENMLDKKLRKTLLKQQQQQEQVMEPYEK